MPCSSTLFGNAHRTLVTVLFMLCVVALAGCSGCKSETGVIKCVEGVDCPIVETCTNVPRIVRTTFEPKDGRVPLTVTFSVVAEDADTIVCDEALTYHFDFDGDGIEDSVSSKGRIQHTYLTAGKYDIKIWVTDNANNFSKPVSKFVVAMDNKPPVIAFLTTTPSSVGIVGGSPFLFDWRAYDPEGFELTAIKVDFGDGSPVVVQAGAVTLAYHSYSKPGQFDIKITAIDVDNAETSRTTSVVVVIPSRPSSMVQTVGSSQAIALDDNGGQYYTDGGGDFLYGYVADGPIALKTVKYPLSAFAASAPQGEAELIGWADPGNRTSDRWSDVVNHGNLVVVSGTAGFQVFNVRGETGSRTCTPQDYEESKARYYAGEIAVSQHCYPGTPTTPAVICHPTAGSGFTWGGRAQELELLYPTGNPGEVWAVGNTLPSTSSNGGLQVVRLDGMLSDDYYVGDPVSCPGGWMHKGWDAFANPNIFQAETLGMVIEGDYAYLGVRGGGFRIVNVGDYMDNRFSSTIQDAFRLDYIAPWAGNQVNGAGVALNQSRFVSETLAAAQFKDLMHRYLTYNDMGDAKDCGEVKNVILQGSSKGATEAVIKVNAATLILPGNRVAFDLVDSGKDDNNGAGYRVTRLLENQSSIVIEGVPSSSAGEWLTVYPNAVSYAVLPSYPGLNPVTFSTSQSAFIAQNGVCRNFLNAYAPVTEPVGVQFQTAPLGFAALSATPDSGILIFDPSGAAAKSGVPRLLTFEAGGVPEQMIAHGDYLYLSGGNQGKVSIIDISDPHHLDMENLSTGIYCYLSCAGNPESFMINRMEYITTSNNPKGVLIIPAGPVGMNALSVADTLEVELTTPGFFNANCPADTSNMATNACKNKVSGLQLRHEGNISDIQMIDNRYALAAQQRGGVLVFDTSAIPYGGTVTFVSHIRTAGDPKAIRVIKDSAGEPKSLWIADSTSFYRIAFTDPARPGSSTQWIPGGGKSNFNCLEYTNNTLMVCYTEPNPANPIYLREMASFSLGDTFPTTPLRIGRNNDSLGKDQCMPLASTLAGDISAGGVGSGFNSIHTVSLAGRYMMFAETSGYGNVLRELRTTSGGAIFTDGNGAAGCQWYAQLGGSGSHLSYQERTGAQAWKRLYTVSGGGNIEAFDIDGFEEELAENGFDTNIGPASLGSRDLTIVAGGMIVYAQKMVALGPYLFVAAADNGAIVVDASKAENMQIIGQTNVTVGELNVMTLNAMAYPAVPGDPLSSYTYMLMISDRTELFGGEGSGIRMIEYPGLERP